jgi:trehalose 6-phosphate phosphatase
VALQHATVAIITGRSVEDCRRRLHFEPHYLIGNHGLEGLPHPHSQPLPSWAERVAQWRGAIAAALPEHPALQGAWIEDKTWSLAVHYRQVADRAKARRLLRPLLDELASDARRIGGKCVYNLLPIDAHDKGDALRALQQLRPQTTALYAGDDDTDEDAFELASPEVLTVRVGLRAGTRAETYLNERADLSQLVQELIDTLAAHPTGAEP